MSIEECFTVSMDEFGGKKVFLCKLCGYRGGRKFEVKRHLASVHAPSQNLKCPVCGKSYKNQIVLKVHMRAQH